MRGCKTASVCVWEGILYRVSRVRMCVCVATRLEVVSVCDCVSVWEARDSLEGVESVGVCIHVWGVLKWGMEV